MYNRLLNTVGKPNGTLKVCSLGCGFMIDYWALTEVLAERDLDNAIDYTGIDVIDWNYKFHEREIDSLKFVSDNIGNYLNSAGKSDYDVYIFPKSIGEFCDADFKAFIDGVIAANSKEKIYFLISLRAEDYNMMFDIKRSEYIKEILCANGYSSDSDPTKRWYFVENKKGIKAFDGAFDYPDEAKELLNSLTDKCGSRDECVLNACSSTICRSPILTANNIYYQVLEFTRGVTQ